MKNVLRMMFAVLICSGMMTGTVYAADSHIDSHVHMTAWFKNPGHESFKFPDVIRGEESDLFDGMGDSADFLVLTQTTGIEDGDVLNIQNDVLRVNDETGEMEDFGLNCQLSMSTSGEFWSLAGKCDVFLPGLGSGRSKGFIRPFPLKEEVVWYKVWESEETGVAVYFFKETAAVLGEKSL